MIADIVNRITGRPVVGPELVAAPACTGNQQCKQQAKPC
jgi:hypothetical protein